jgi:UDP-2-acetamido-3-amino-2,3-dideoxy-glucuronate N-acetyltransferase
MGGKEKINVSLIGLGRWGNNHLRTLCEQMHESVNVTVFDKRKELVVAAKKKYSEVSASSSADEAIETTDATIIATPSNSHVGIASRAIWAGQDVFIEKPIAQTVTGATTLISYINEATKKGRGPVVMVNHMLLYSEAANILKGLITDGKIGRPVYYRANRSHFGWSVESENAVTSLMIHDIYMVEHLLDSKIAIINGSVGAVRLSDATASGVTDSGVEFSLMASWIHNKKERITEIVGTDGTLVWDDDKKTISVFPYSVHDQQIVRGDGEVVVIDVSSTMSPLESSLRHFIGCVVSRNTPTSDVIAGKRAVFLCDVISHVATGTQSSPEKHSG